MSRHMSNIQGRLGRVAGLLLALVALLPACGETEPGRNTARIGMSVVIPAPEYRGLSTDVEQQIEQLRAVNLVVMICDDVTAHTALPCNRKEPRTYHALETFSLTKEEKGSATFSVPAGTEQVVFAQGLNTAGDVTYQGYATMPVIQPRNAYTVALPLKQIRFANLPPPTAPVIVEPEEDPSQLAHGLPLVIRGTRQAGTVLRVKAHRDLIGSFSVDFNVSDPPRYTQAPDPADPTWLEWKLEIDSDTLDARRGTHFESFTFQAIRSGQLSPEVTLSIRLCASTGCPQ